jgi:hypothetical protein
VLFFDRELAREFEWRVKQAGHLNSKMRLVTAPWLALLENGVWLENARHANAMAQRLSERLARLEGVRPIAPVQSNGVFVELPPSVQAKLRERGWRFYTFLARPAAASCAPGTPRPTRSTASPQIWPPPSPRPKAPSPRKRGEGRGEGQVLAPEPACVAAPHPSPLPVRTGRGDSKSGERGQSFLPRRRPLIGADGAEHLLGGIR